MTGRVAGRVVVVTGGAGGIGGAACAAIAAEGGKVVVADLDPDRARAVAEAIVADGGEATSVDVDVTDRARVRRMIQTAVDTFGELNVIFNNAGMNRPRTFMAMSVPPNVAERPLNHRDGSCSLQRSLLRDPRLAVWLGPLELGKTHRKDVPRRDASMTVFLDQDELLSVGQPRGYRHFTARLQLIDER